jgi:large subunit ribosomal protein L17
VTLAKKGGLANRRLAAARVRDPAAVQTLFNERVGEFVNRNGGYTRIYKLGPQRRGDAAEMAIIEWVSADDVGYRSGKRKPKAKKAEAGAKAAAAEGAEATEATEEPAKEAPPEETVEPKAEAAAEEAPAQEKAAAEEPAAEEEKENDKK